MLKDVVVFLNTFTDAHNFIKCSAIYEYIYFFRLEKNGYY